MNEKISIIVPVYNSENWLSRCIHSIKNQSYYNLEIILVNDGSSDNSGKICDEYAKLDKRIKVLHKQNEGTSAARNEGLKISTGCFVQFVDSDDWIEEVMCETLLKYINDADSELVMCGLNVWEDGRKLRSVNLSYKKLKVKESVDNYNYLHKIFSSPCNKLYRKDYINSIFNTNISLGEDLMFNLNYLKYIENVLVIEEHLYNVSLDNKNSLNRRFRDDRLDLVIELVNKELEFCDEIYGEFYDRTQLYNAYILAVHAFFREIILKKYKSKKDFMSLFKKYANYSIIKEAAARSSLNRFDYKIFNYLLVNKHVIVAYYFFRVKELRRIK